MAHTAALDMTQGSLSRQIIGFSLPLMFTNLLQMLLLQKQDIMLVE